MILRKPYGFLIKHFKKIHLILLLLLCYIIYKTKNFLDFFESYIASGYTTKLTSFANDYFSFFTFLIFAITIGSLVAIFLLMRSKQKSTKYYITTIIYYSILLVIFLFSYNVLLSLETTTVEASAIRVYRDIFNMFYIPQFLFIIFTLLRGVGFDIKSFNFKKDLEDLDLDDEDEEEVEVSINIEGYKVKRQARRSLREFKYYILENSFVFTCLVGGGLIVAAISLFLNFQVYNKRYKINQSFAHETFSISFKDSLLTDRDYQGNIIQEGKYYLAAIINVQNTIKAAQVLDTSQFKLVIGNEIIYPTLDRSGKFADVALPYYGTAIAGASQSDYVLVYELTEEELKTSYQIKILTSVEYGEKELIPRYKIIKLKPRIETNASVEDEVSLKEGINLKETALGESTFVINDYTIADKYEYTYDFCYAEVCYPSKNSLIINPQEYYNKTLLILDSELELDETTFYALDKASHHNFYEDFFVIKYEIDGKEYQTRADEVTPQAVKDKTILMTSGSIENAEKISISITIRNKTYVINLKD